MFALVDCNNFFVSCERVFRPDLQNKPVMVLSNNDGCIISRSNEVKALGIPMGVPLFKVKDIVAKHRVTLFSSNFKLYGDLSSRVMQTLKHLCPRMEVYSIDEAFIDCQGIADLRQFAEMVRQTVLQWTGIPISIGIAPTKTLAKVANYFAKKDLANCHIYIMRSETEIDRALAIIPINDIWGVGRQTADKLKAHGLFTGLDLKQAPLKWIRQLFTVIGERLLQELRGIPCRGMENHGAPKSIQVTRSFDQPIRNFEQLCQVVAFYASCAGRRLRQSRQTVKSVMVYARTSRFHFQTYHSRSATVTLPGGVDDDSALIKACTEALQELFVAGQPYKKAGVILLDLMPKEVLQYDLFSLRPTATEQAKTDQLSKAIDQLNGRYGRGTIFYAACGRGLNWRDNKGNLSPGYTTNWQEILTVK
ncbi:Y-family DNA polymerase [Candidatus Paracaedibacter symbiosus]|uniref:Y-family DNA polymerase n=1 Tax=Candidatus Paracaedibacter symbiosus TaxID=244582 RepID=UPI0005098CF3|nr:Y-family DNA polymerase [Candidatus Paracaedibacter symbiosus]